MLLITIDSEVKQALDSFGAIKLISGLMVICYVSLSLNLVIYNTVVSHPRIREAN